VSNALPDKVRDWLDRPTFVSLATIEPNGRPQVSALWVKRDGDDVLFSTVAGRRKHKNLVRDPRATALVIGPDNPYDFVEMRGRVTMTTEGGRELIDELSLKYKGELYTADRPDAVRVVIRLTPSRVRFRG
jgi:PPOX class probable F420-dependent enzyme